MSDDVPDYTDGSALVDSSRAPSSEPRTLRVAVAGAGSVGVAIALELVESGHEVLVIDKVPIDPDQIPGATVETADACEFSTLERIELARYDAVVAASGDDKVNLVVSLLAKTEFVVDRVVARVNDPVNEWLFDERWGVDVAVSTPRLMVALLEEAVAVGNVVRLMSFSQSSANLVGITLPDRTPLAGRPVSKLELPKKVALVTIVRGDRAIIPEPDVPFEPGDELLFVAPEPAEDDLREAVLG